MKSFWNKMNLSLEKTVIKLRNSDAAWMENSSICPPVCFLITRGASSAIKTRADHFPSISPSNKGDPSQCVFTSNNLQLNTQNRQPDRKKTELPLQI